MNKHGGYWVIAAAVVLIAAILAAPMLGNTNEGDKEMQVNGNIPPIDAALPEVTETATFALG